MFAATLPFINAGFYSQISSIPHPKRFAASLSIPESHALKRFLDLGGRKFLPFFGANNLWDVWDDCCVG